MPFVWQENGISIRTIGILIALFSVFGAFASYTGGKLSNKLGERNILILSFLPTIPLLLTSLHLLKINQLLSFIFFILAGFMLTLAASVNIVVAQKAAPENMGMVSGIIGGFSWGLAGILLTPIGFSSDIFGAQNILFLVALTPVLGLIPAFLLKEYKA